jgi:hypothetical protein
MLVPVNWPKGQVVYGTLGLLGLFIIVWPIVRAYLILRTRVDDLLDRARELQKRAHIALDASLSYAEHHYALGWCALLSGRLAVLIEEVRHEDDFDTAFGPLKERRASADEAVLDRLKVTLVPKMRVEPRQKWLDLLLREWPVAEKIEVELGGEGRFIVHSMFLREGFEREDTELAIVPLSVPVAA